MKNKFIIESGKILPDLNYWSLAFTGHANIEKGYGEKQLPNGFGYNAECVDGIGMDSANKLYRQIKKTIEKFIEANQDLNNKKPRIIVGMARGVDEIAGLVAMDMNLDLVCCVPHSIAWHMNRAITNRGRVQALFYNKFLEYNNAIWYEIRKSYSCGWPFANFARNAAMVDLADKVISFKCYDSAGTDHCIKLAKKAGKYAGNISKE